MSIQTGTTSSTANAAPLRTDTLGGSALLILALTPLQRLVGIARALVVAVLLTPAELGEWDLAFSFMSLAAPLAILGLPGSFGRYVERYSQQGQLRMLLRRTMMFSAVLGSVFMLTVVVTRPGFSSMIFGTPDHGSLVILLAVAVGAVILFNFLGSLLSAMRMYRVFAVQQFACTAGFALLSVGLLFCWQRSATAIIVAYGVACLLTAAGSAVWIGRVWRGLPVDTATVPQWNFWSTLMPFAVCIWLTDVATNLLVVIDRYMLIHCSTAAATEVLAAIGQFHCARIVPNVLTALAFAAATMLTPHLAQKWEAGQRDSVEEQLRFILKLTCVALTFASAVFLLMAEFGLQLGIGEKYAQAVSLLPATLLCGVWLGMFGIAQNYAWCAERAWWSCLTIVPGIVLNVAVSCLLVPRYGLGGTVMATTAGHLVVIVLSLAMLRWLGMRSCRTSWMIVALPAVLWFGGCWAMIGILASLAVASRSELLFNHHEKAVIADQCRRNLQRILHLWDQHVGRRFAGLRDYSASQELTVAQHSPSP